MSLKVNVMSDFFMDVGGTAAIDLDSEEVSGYL